LQVEKAPIDALQTLEQATTTVIRAILAEQTGMGGRLNVSTKYTSFITLPTRNVTLSELQRLKRQFVTTHKKVITLGTTEKGIVDFGEQSIIYKFVTYLEENLRL
jgi:protein KTI12